VFKILLFFLFHHQSVFAQVPNPLASNHRTSVLGFLSGKRPFFSKNSSYVDTPITLVFTRRLLIPQYGLLLTGSAGPVLSGNVLPDYQSSVGSVAPATPLHDIASYFDNRFRVNPRLGSRPHRFSYKHRSRADYGSQHYIYAISASSNQIAWRQIDAKSPSAKTGYTQFQPSLSSTDFNMARTSGLAFHYWLEPHTAQVEYHVI